MVSSSTARSHKVDVHLRLDPETLAKLDSEAEREGLSRSTLIRALLEDRLAEEFEDRYWAAQAEAALSDPNDQERIPLSQIKRELGL